VETRSIVEAFDEAEEGGPSGLSGLEGFILHQLGGYSLLQSALVEPGGVNWRSSSGRGKECLLLGIPGTALWSAWGCHGGASGRPSGNARRPGRCRAARAGSLSEVSTNTGGGPN
jgi:hypothetical protein